MWIIIVCAIIGAVIGIIVALLDEEWDEIFGNIFKGGIICAIAGVVLAGMFSGVVWMFTNDSHYHLETHKKCVIEQNDEDEFLYFSLVHESSTTYLYVMDENQEIQQTKLNNLTVQFIDESEIPYIETQVYQYNSKFLQACAFRPVKKMISQNTLYISEADWMKYTHGNLEDVETLPAE